MKQDYVKTSLPSNITFFFFLQKCKGYNDLFSSEKDLMHWFPVVSMIVWRDRLQILIIYYASSVISTLWQGFHKGNEHFKNRYIRELEETFGMYLEV